MKKGFTLLELIIVIIILGILASFAIPQFIRAAEKARSGEALGLLPVLGQSQVRRGVERNAYTNVVGNLDVDIAVPRYFSVVLLDTGNPTDVVNDSLVRLVRNVAPLPPLGMGAYTFTYCESGAVFCTDGAAGDCEKLTRPNLAACP